MNKIRFIWMSLKLWFMKPNTTSKYKKSYDNISDINLIHHLIWLHKMFSRTPYKVNILCNIYNNETLSNESIPILKKALEVSQYDEIVSETTEWIEKYEAVDSYLKIDGWETKSYTLVLFKFE